MREVRATEEGAGLSLGAGMFWALGGYAALCTLALTWPLYPWVLRHLPPLLGGVPSGLVWSVGWVLSTFLVLLAFHSRYQRAIDAASETRA